MKELEAAREIHERVDRLLRSADAYGRFPTPVDDLVSAAKLSQADDYVLDDSLIDKAPRYLRHLLRSAKNKIQGLVDRRSRVIHISPSIDHDGKRRFIKLHEIVHDIMPHQQDLLYADDNETLAASTKRLFEREANQGAAELLFQRDAFARDADDFQISVSSVWTLANRYGSSFHAALRRYGEQHPGAVATLVLERKPISADPPTWRRQETSTTPKWDARMGPAAWPRHMDSSKFPFLAALDFSDLDAIRLPDVHGDTIDVRVDTFQSPYNNFVLLWLPPKRRLVPRRKSNVLMAP